MGFALILALALAVAVVMTAMGAAEAQRTIRSGSGVSSAARSNIAVDSLIASEPSAARRAPEASAARRSQRSGFHSFARNRSTESGAVNKPGDAAMFGMNINVPDPLEALAKGEGPLGAPPLIVLSATELAFESTDTLGLYRATAPVKVSVGAQWPQWRLSCLAVDVQGPDGAEFSARNIFMRGGLGPVEGGGAGDGSAYSLDAPQIVAEGEQTGHEIIGVANLEFYLQLNQESGSGDYAFTIQFFGEGSGASGPLELPKCFF